MVLAFWAAVAVDRRSRRARRRRHHLLLLRSRAPGQSQRVTYAPILEVARRGDRCDDRLCRADPMGPTARTPMTPGGGGHAGCLDKHEELSTAGRVELPASRSLAALEAAGRRGRSAAGERAAGRRRRAAAPAARPPRSD